MSVSDNGTPRIFYRVCRWREIYENAQSRPVKYLHWLASPIMIGSSDYAELMDQPNGMAYYGLWRSFTELAAQCQPRGSLLKEGGTPHNQKSIALTLRCSEELLQNAIGSFLLLGWLEEVPFTKQGIYNTLENQQESKESLQNSRDALQNTKARARERTGQDSTENNIPPTPLLSRGELMPSDTAHTGRRRPRGMTKAEELTQHMFQRHKDGTL